MRVLAISAIMLNLLCAPTYAQKVDVSTVKCRDMATHSPEKNALILMWLQGYYSDEDASPIIDFDKMLKDEKKLVAYCEKIQTTASSPQRTKFSTIKHNSCEVPAAKRLAVSLRYCLRRCAGCLQRGSFFRAAALVFPSRSRRNPV